MTDRVESKLTSVRRRQQGAYILQSAATGLLIGSALAAIFALARLSGIAVSPALALAVAVMGLIGGAAWGALRSHISRTWHHAAEAVDGHYQLKDRAVSALAFSHDDKASDLHHLQIDDTMGRLERLDPRRVSPWQMPKTLPYAVAVCGLAVALVLLPVRSGRQNEAAAAPLAQVLNDAQLLEETVIEELEQLAEEQKDEELEELIEELKAMVEEMKEPGVDFREELAKLSSMEAAIADAQAEFNLEEVDAQLKELAQALSPAAMMQPAVSALQEGDYDKAAEELEAFDPQGLERKEKKAMEDNLKKLVKSMQDAGQSNLGEATQEFCDGLSNDNNSQCKNGASKLGKACRKQGLRKRAGACLGKQLNRLAQCKSQCRGNCNKPSSLVMLSDKPSNKWGKGASNQATSDNPTSIDTARQREDITGAHGEGPSEKEVSHASEGREQASREYREKYQQFKKMNEAVLESEALPLGHRQTIRKYFESIRPQNEDPTQ